MKTNKEYKNDALAALKGNWAQAVLAAFVMLVISELTYAITWGFDCLGVNSLVETGVLTVYAFLLASPFVVGVANSFNRLYFKSEGNVLENMKSLALSDYGRSVAGMLMMSVVTSLYSLLLWVPGLIASLALFLVPYILKDNPELSIMDTLRLSRKMMDGHKWQLFKLQLSFIGWILLNVLTLGIASLWLVPYMMTTMAAFYQDVKAEYLMKEVRQESAL